MKLQGVDYGPIWGASGVQGFFGEGYWFHRYLKPFGLDFTGVTFTAKTTPVSVRRGNMPLKEDGITPREWFPRSVIVRFREAIMLNAVRLSGFGFEFYLKKKIWQSLEKPFALSFAALGQSVETQIAEFQLFCSLIKKYETLGNFMSPFSIQINRSCPNLGHDIKVLAEGTVKILQAGREILLGVPFIPKFNVLTQPEFAAEVAEINECDAICVSNTIPYGELSDRIDWGKLFGSLEISPLEWRFGSGVKGELSGKPLLPLVCEWVRKARECGLKKPIIAGGGVLCSDDVDKLVKSGASAVSIGSVATLRPWRVKSIIRRAYQVVPKF